LGSHIQAAEGVDVDLAAVAAEEALTVVCDVAVDDFATPLMLAGR
jgi:hypothetical protein